jgi:ParB-like chromosome segregation protein Spo0J
MIWWVLGGAALLCGVIALLIWMTNSPPPELKDIPIDKIDLPTNCPPVDDLSSLEMDMAVNGQIRPIPVLSQGTGRYLLMDGMRRLAVAKELGWHEVKCKVYYG